MAMAKIPTIKKEFGMKDKHRSCLRLNLTYLQDELVMDPLLNSLKENSVMHAGWIRDIQDTPVKCRFNKFIDCLKRSGPDAWDGFLSSLKEINQQHIAWRLEETECLYDKNPKIDARTLKEYFKNVPPPPQLPIPKRHDSMVSMNLDPQAGPSVSHKNDSYEMKSYPRGWVLIINNVKFEKKDCREDSNYDRDRLQNMFQKFGFRVFDPEENLTKEEMLTALKEFARVANEYRNIDSLVVVVLSHGGQGDVIYGVDEQTISHEELKNPFNGNSCENMKGKPKLFIIQACRGSDYRKSLPTDGPTRQGKGSAPSKKMMLAGGESDENPASVEEVTDILENLRLTGNEKPTIYTHPDDDMFFGYSTIPGSVSYRDESRGSWYIMALCEVFETHAHDTEVLRMLALTNREVKKYAKESHVPCPEGRFTSLKSWFLCPLKPS